MDLRFNILQRAHDTLQNFKTVSRIGLAYSQPKPTSSSSEKQKPTPIFHTLLLNGNTIIPLVDLTKVLGLHFYLRHSLLPHIKISQKSSRIKRTQTFTHKWM